MRKTRLRRERSFRYGLIKLWAINCLVKGYGRDIVTLLISVDQ